MSSSFSRCPAHFSCCSRTYVRWASSIASLLAAGGCEPQLRVHLNGGLNVGLPPEKIVETLIHCVPYVGFPRVLNAVSTAKEVFASREL